MNTTSTIVINGWKPYLINDNNDIVVLDSKYDW